MNHIVTYEILMEYLYLTGSGKGLPSEDHGHDPHDHDHASPPMDTGSSQDSLA